MYGAERGVRDEGVTIQQEQERCYGNGTPPNEVDLLRECQTVLEATKCYVVSVIETLAENIGTS